MKKSFNRKYPKVNYIGNKEKIAAWIVESLPIKNGKVLDIFSGGNSVSYALKNAGFEVHSNDVLYSSYVISKSLIENSTEILDSEQIKLANDIELNPIELNRFNWLANNLFFDYEIEELAKLIIYSEQMVGYEKYLFQALIRRAIIRKMPYSRLNIPWKNILKLRDEEYSYQKYGRRRAYHNESFTSHILKNLKEYNDAIFCNSKPNKSYQEDVFELLINIEKVDLIYLDPPYPGTMNKYSDFYMTFDLLFGKEKEFTDLTSSDNFINNLEEIIKLASLKANYLVLSINSNSNPGSKEVVELFENYGNVTKFSRKHNYQISGKLNKNKNYEELIILEFRG